MIGAHVENIVNAQTAAQRRLCRTVCVCVCVCVCVGARPSRPRRRSVTCNLLCARSKAGAGRPHVKSVRGEAACR